ncbi:MAG: universal stress protein [Candidatus Brocadiaceae bacterium]|nr:universal stress protein [Candidatus Brocadiaceae bacterium]
MKHVVVTTDFSPAAEAAFEYAKKEVQLLGKEQCRITLLNVIDVIASTDINTEYGLELAHKKGLIEELYEQSIKKMKEIVNTHFTDFCVKTVVLKSEEPIYHAIVEFVEGNDVDLIILSTHGRTGVKHLFLGSVAERVIRQSPCPVLVVPAKKGI